MVNTALAKGHHVQILCTARIFFMFHTVAVRPEKKLYRYIIIFDWGRQCSQVRLPMIQVRVHMYVQYIYVYVHAFIGTSIGICPDVYMYMYCTCICTV